MTKTRLEAFSDGVIAILITIMVLELRAPAGSDLPAPASALPEFALALLSFVVVCRRDSANVPQSLARRRALRPGGVDMAGARSPNRGASPRCTSPSSGRRVAIGHLYGDARRWKPRLDKPASRPQVI